jgi:hypothetical protein
MRRRPFFQGLMRLFRQPFDRDRDHAATITQPFWKSTLNRRSSRLPCAAQCRAPPSLLPAGVRSAPARPRRRPAVVDDEISVLLRDHGAADARAFQPSSSISLPAGIVRRILEHAAGARRGGLRIPAFLAVGAHALGMDSTESGRRAKRRPGRCDPFNVAQQRDRSPTSRTA